VARRGSVDDDESAGSGTQSGGHSKEGGFNGGANGFAPSGGHGGTKEGVHAGVSRSSGNAVARAADEAVAAASDDRRRASGSGSMSSGSAGGGVDEWWHDARQTRPVNEDALRNNSIVTDDGASMASLESAGADGMAVPGGSAGRTTGAAQQNGLSARETSMAQAARDEMGGTPAARATGLMPPAGPGATGRSKSRGGSMSSGTGTDGPVGSMDSGISGRQAAESFVDQGNWWEAGR